MYRSSIWIRYYSCMLFPGQGAQYVGMTSRIQDLPAVQSLFEQANEILGYDLQSLCLTGPESKLQETRYCQPAIVVASLAAASVAEKEGIANDGCIQAATGLSVGELTALIFAGAMSFKAGLQLVAVRAAAMQMASRQVSSSNVRVTGLDKEQTEDLCNTVKQSGYGDCSISNELFAKGYTVACSTKAVDFVSDHVQQTGGRTEVLTLSGAFHSSYMSSATEHFAAAVSNTPLQLPKLPVYSNVTGQPYSSVQDIRSLLVKQLTSCIVWGEVMANIMKDYPRCSFVECGPGRQITYLVKKLNKQAKCTNFNV